MAKVREDRRRLVLTWIYYKKSFHYFPQSWMLEAFQIAKVPVGIGKAKADLILSLVTILILHQSTRKANSINYTALLFE